MSAADRICKVGRSPAEAGRDAIRRAKAANVDVIALTGAPGHSLPAHVLDAITTAVRTTTHSVHSAGISELRNAIARRTEVETGVAVDPESQVVLTNGGMHALFASALALGEVGDQIVIPSPCYFFRGNFELAGLRPVYVASSPENGWALDFTAIKRALNGAARLLCLTTPNNPTGYMLSADDLDRIASIIKGKDVWLLADESYESVTFEGHKHISPMSHPSLRDRTITVKTFSKGFCLRDYRVGYVIAPSAAVGEAIRSAVEWTVLSTNYIGQRAALAALEGPRDWIDSMVAEVRANRQKMESALRSGNRVGWVSPQGGPYLYVDVSALGAPEDVSSALLSRYGVATLPGSAFTEKNHIRVPFGGPTGRIEEAANRLASAFSELPQVSRL